MSNVAEAAAQAHAHPRPNYVRIWAILVVLLVVSVCGPLLGVKIVTMITAFGIAIVKAYLVAKNFMHINLDRRYVIYLELTMVGLMLLLFFGVSPDVMKHDGQRWENVAAKQEVARAEKSGEGHGTTVAAAAPAHLTPQQNFQAICSPCHGEKGDGQGPAGAALNPHPANFTDPAFWQTRDRAHIEKVIREGGASVGKSPLMVAFGAQFSPADLSALAGYVMAFNPAAAAPAPASDGGSAPPVPAAPPPAK